MSKARQKVKRGLKRKDEGKRLKDEGGNASTAAGMKLGEEGQAHWKAINRSLD
jgi:hypothetical protein